MKKNVLLIGIGPHAKRIYINYLKTHRVNLKLVVELESNKDKTIEYLNQQGFVKTKLLFLPDEYKDNKHLPCHIFIELKKICEELDINHIMISTEPKAHYMYIEFALQNNINVLTDKPITANREMFSKLGASEIKTDYYKLLKLEKNSLASCKVMCQRQYHRGYTYIKKILEETVIKYQIPITYIDIYHSDGNWEMPHDLLKENHPYKYGYGKLFHSGYHFIDLLSDLIKINNNLCKTKAITNFNLYSNSFTPKDELDVFNIEDYKRIFNNQEIPDYYSKENYNFENFGEKNFYSLFEFKNSKGNTITNVSMNLLHYGFSRRGWIKTRDFYKSNGRIRHERMNIQVGPLMNIQVHSYQSKEIKDREDILTEENIGGLEHFDILIFRNSDLIGGKPFEKISLGDLYKTKEKENMLGYNELARNEFISNFLNDKCDKSDLKEHGLGIEILYKCALSNIVHKKLSSKINKQEILPFNIYELKDYVVSKYKNEEKELINHYEKNSEYNYGVNLYYLSNLKKYYVYMYIEQKNKIVSNLLLKEYNSKIFSYIYFKFLCKLANLNNINIIKNTIKTLN